LELCQNGHHERFYMKTATTRKGKIARLPLAIRQELNTRLRNGEMALNLVLWLNGLPAVHEVLLAQFKGKPIEECNLSRWKTGGYTEWLLEQITHGTSVNEVLAMSPDLVTQMQGGLSDKMAVLLASRMLLEFRRVPLEGDSEPNAKQWRELRLNVATLKRYEFFNRQMPKGEAGKGEAADGEEKRPRRRSAEETRRAVARILGIDPDGPRINPETDPFEGPGAEALNEQREKLKAEDRLEAEEQARMARMTQPQPGVIQLQEERADCTKLH
jgi:hypothetical protein